MSLNAPKKVYVFEISEESKRDIKMFKYIHDTWNGVYVHLNNLIHCLNFIKDIWINKTKTYKNINEFHFEILSYLSYVITDLKDKSTYELFNGNCYINKKLFIDEFNGDMTLIHKKFKKLFTFPRNYKDKELFELNKKQFFTNLHDLKLYVNVLIDVMEQFGDNYVENLKFTNLEYTKKLDVYNFNISSKIEYIPYNYNRENSPPLLVIDK